jgi:hypothetical protein
MNNETLEKANRLQMSIREPERDITKLKKAEGEIFLALSSGIYYVQIPALLREEIINKVTLEYEKELVVLKQELETL